jgi:hypothetical protein
MNEEGDSMAIGKPRTEPDDPISSLLVVINKLVDIESRTDYQGSKIEEIQNNLRGIIGLLEKSKKWYFAFYCAIIDFPFTLTWSLWGLVERIITSIPIQLSREMRKITIQATSGIATILEEKLRNKYEVRVEVIPDNPNAICQIMGRKNRTWITICSFASDENIRDIITMFEVNFQLRRWILTKREAFGFRIQF